MRFWIAFFLVMVSTHLAASTIGEYEQLQMPLCLATQLPSSYSILAENKAFKIIELPSRELDSMVLLADKVGCGRFVNVSHVFGSKSLVARKRLATELLTKKQAIKPVLATYPIEHSNEVIPAMQQVNAANMLANLTFMTEYYNRSATKPTGVDTAEWLKKTFDDLAETHARTDAASWFVPTNLRYQQPSVVTVIGKDIKAPAIVIGAHMDTLDGRMPGAGDDASGAASIMEIARILLASSNQLQRPIYFVWYAAEERGLVGSQRVVTYFRNKKIPVKAVLQFDMVAYRSDANDPTMWVYQDYTDRGLNDFVAKLIETYIHVPVGRSQCGYGCSDHASWTDQGIPAAFPCETDFKRQNQKIHSSEDTIDRLNTEHLVNFTKLGLAFAIELIT